MPAGDGWIRRNILFYLLNTLHDLHMAREARLLDAAMATSLMVGQLEALRARADDVRALLRRSTGYSAAFCARVDAALR